MVANLILSADAASAPLTRIGPAQAAPAPTPLPVVASSTGALHPPARTAAAALTAVAAREAGARMLVALAHLHRLEQERLTLRHQAHRLIFQL